MGNPFFTEINCIHKTILISINIKMMKTCGFLLVLVIAMCKSHRGHDHDDHDHGVCKDNKASCSISDCRFRYLQCKKTCGLCEDTTWPCRDSYPFCNGRRCGKLQNACRRTCGKCEAAPFCADDEPQWYCAYYKKTICQKSPGKCKRTCNTCEEF